MTAAIIAHLGSVDPVMRQLIAAAGPFAIETREEHSPFEALARAIAHQQLNGKAAQSILNRFITTCGQGVFPAPAGLLALEDSALRAAGFSFQRSRRCAIWLPRPSVASSRCVRTCMT